MGKLKIDLKWVIIILLSIALLWSMRTCNNRDGQISQLQLEKQTTDSIVNKYGQTILTQEAIVTNNEMAIKQLTDSIFNLTKAQDRKIKDVIAYYTSTSKIIVKDKLVPYIDAQARKQWEDSVNRVCRNVIDYYEANTIGVPRTATDSTTDYKATFTAKANGIYIDSLIIPDNQYIRFVIFKGGVLKKDASGKKHLFTKRSVQVQVLHTNKLLQVTGQNSAIYIPTKKANILAKALLIGGGIFIGTKL